MTLAQTTQKGLKFSGKSGDLPPRERKPPKGGPWDEVLMQVYEAIKRMCDQVSKAEKQLNETVELYGAKGIVLSKKRDFPVPDGTVSDRNLLMFDKVEYNHTVSRDCFKE